MEEGSTKLVGVFTTDTDLVIRLWDPTLERMTGRAARDVVGNSLTEAVPRVLEKRLLDRFERSLKEGTTEILAAALHGFLIPCPPLEASEFFTEMRQNVKISPLKQESGPTGLIVTVEDVTRSLDRKLAISAKLKHEQKTVRLEGAREIAAEAGPITSEAAAPIINGLADEDWRVRRRLVEAMGKRAAPDAIDALLGALKQRHLDFATVNSALQVLKSTSVEVVEPLVAMLTSEETDLRMHAALALGELGDRSASPALIASLDDEDVNVRYHAIEALGKLKAEDAVSRLVETAEQKDFFLSFIALESLAAIGAAAEGERISELLHDEVLWEPAARALAGTGDPQYASKLIALLDRNQVPVSVVAELFDLLLKRDGRKTGAGPEVDADQFAPLSSNAKTRLLASLRTVSNKGSEPLISFASRFPDEDIAAALADHLYDSELEDIIAGALRRQGSSAVTPLLSKLVSSEPRVKTVAARLLGELGDQRAVAELLRVIERDDGSASDAALALGRIGGSDAFGHLLNLVENSDGDKRAAAAKGLALLNDPSAELRLVELLKDPDPTVRSAAVEAFGNIGSERSAEVLIASCDDPDENVRKAAVKCLASVGGQPAEERLIFSLRHDTPPVRTSAAVSLGERRTDASRAALVEALGDHDSWTRYFAIRSLARYRDVSLAEHIDRIAKSDPAEHVRMAAIDVLNELGM